MTQPSRVDVLTFGCRLNTAESDAMRRHALAAGHRDLTIVNTCAVTAEAVRQGRQAVRRAAKEHPEGRLVVTGCAAEIDRSAFLGLVGVDAVLPNAAKADAASWPRVADAAPLTPPPEPQHTRGFVEIQNGCDHRCTFCIIPFGRGVSRSTPAAAIVARVRRLVEDGVADVILTGVDITSYRDESADGATLGRLVKRILREVPDLPRLRLSSLDCIEADSDLLDALGTEERLMPHLHLSLQAGADLVLKRMKRRHTRAEAIRLCADLRRRRPEIAFGADLIAGFPTESEAMFHETIDLIEACGLAYVHVFPYSLRPGTPAARMPQVAPDIVKARAEVLRREAEARLRAHLANHMGRTETVLMERGGKGRTPDFSLVSVPEGPPPGAFHRVRITGHEARHLLSQAA